MSRARRCVLTLTIAVEVGQIINVPARERLRAFAKTKLGFLVVPMRLDLQAEHGAVHDGQTQILHGFFIATGNAPVLFAEGAALFDGMAGADKQGVGHPSGCRRTRDGALA